MRSILVTSGMLALLIVPCGACSKEKLNELADQAKKAVAEGTDTVKKQASAVADTAKEAVALAGSCELTLDTPFKASACYLTFLPQESGRPHVLQLHSYKDPSQESFPSYLLQSQVTVTSPSQLVGQTVPAQLFVQPANDSPIWSCPPGSHIDLKVVSVDDKLLNAEIVGGSVRNSHTGASQSVVGKLSAVLP